MNLDLDPHPIDVLVYGGGGHGKMVIEILRGMAQYRIAGLIDDGLTPGSSVAGVPVLGGSASLPELYARGIHTAFNAVAGVGNIARAWRSSSGWSAPGSSCRP